nr:hypothetical protein [Mycobacterium spongiae]
MKVKRTYVGAALVGCAAALLFTTGVASAAPPDPHMPDLVRGFCPGGRTDSQGIGGVTASGGWINCDGVKYPDGSFWRQGITQNTGIRFFTDCLSGDGIFAGTPPPGGCNGAIPPA